MRLTLHHMVNKLKADHQLVSGFQDSRCILKLGISKSGGIQPTKAVAL